MLKTAEPKKGGDGAGGDIRTRHDGSKIDGSGMDDVEVDGGEVEVEKVGKKAQNLSKSKNFSKSKKMVGSDFLIPRAKLAFTKMGQAFFKVSILQHFDSKHHMRIEMDISGYAIGRVLS